MRCLSFEKTWFMWFSLFRENIEFPLENITENPADFSKLRCTVNARLSKPFEPKNSISWWSSSAADFYSERTHLLQVVHFLRYQFSKSYEIISHIKY